MKTGLVSVTFRSKTPQEIIELVRKAGLDGIEWGSDVHATSPEKAAEIRAMMGDLKVISLGSYYRLGEGQNFRDIMEIAKALGTDHIRIWAGSKEPENLTKEQYRTLVAEAQKIADMAAEEKMTVSFEYHGGTLTCTQKDALALMEAIDRPNMKLYWQPLDSNPIGRRVRDIREICNRNLLTNMHVFYWFLGGERRPLSEGETVWRDWLKEAKDHVNAAMIEFVMGETEEQFFEDAALLKQMVEETEA